MQYKINEIKKMKTGVLMGGWSGEREISLRSGKNVFNALKKAGCNVISIDVDKNIVDVLLKEKIDIAYIAMHGIFGEDGGIQAILEMLEIPYTGSNVLASAIGMNKLMSKRVAISENIKTSAFLEIKDYKKERDTIDKIIGFPLVLKPVNEGSSIGVYIVKDQNELDEIMKLDAEKYSKVFIEKYIKGREVTVGVLSSKFEEIVLPILELKPKKEFYDFEAKYTKGLTEFILPAELDKSMTRFVQKQALAIHSSLGCKGASRSDFIIDNNGEVYFLEINTSPGMTDTSDVPAEAKVIGIEMEDLVMKILLSAF